MRTRILGVTLLAVLAAPVVLGTVRTSGRIIVPEDEVVTEDLYGFGDLVVVEGTINGDLFVVASEVRVSGRVTGDVIGLVGGPVIISGEIDGALRVASFDLDVTGRVGDDLVALVGQAKLDGSLGRDLVAIGGELAVGGSIGRDIRLQSLRLSIGGPVGGDVLVDAQTLRLSAGAAVEGDVVYAGDDEASVAPEASVDGRIVRRTTISPVWAKAVTRLVAVLGFGAFVVTGLIGSWLFRATATRSVGLAGDRPWRSAGVGLLLVVGMPVLVATLFLTLVGIPFALIVLLTWALALALGPLPAVTRFGTVLLRRRGGSAGALVIGALVWRTAIWLLPLIAGMLYLAALLVGLGSFAIAGWEQRRLARV